MSLNSMSLDPVTCSTFLEICDFLKLWKIKEQIFCAQDNIDCRLNKPISTRMCKVQVEMISFNLPEFRNKF